MWHNRLIMRGVRTALCVVQLSAFTERLSAQSEAAHPGVTNMTILMIEGSAEIMRSGAKVWDRAQTHQVLYPGDRLRTGENSRITLRWSDQSIVRIKELSDFQIQPVSPTTKRSGFSLWQGMLYFFHRDKPADLQFNTRTASAAVRGTEFNLETEENGRTILTLLDGTVELSNNRGQVSLQSGDQGIAEPGQAPRKTAVINTINVIQWALYYPAVLDLDELPLSPDEQQVLQPSMAAYRSGDLLQALADYPANRTPVSPAEKVYFGAVLLAVGEVDRLEKLFDSLEPGVAQPQPSSAALAEAIRELVAAVKFQPWQRSRAPELATEWLAESYYEQSLAALPQALEAARKAVEKSPKFGLGWARVAELEFSFGRVPEAIDALEKSLELGPRNAQALALKGFLLGAQNRIQPAILYFEQAMAVDGALANAWLGRGLCRIRQNKTDAGREDLLVAAALEPQRALLRSYLGKAYGDAGDVERAARELALARKLDEKDPTAWLYLALLKEQNSQINGAVRDLEKSQELNKNRRVYRSQLLLDQDRAVRSANLANVYRDAGMIDLSVREAGRAVSADYANYSAHLFLANSYDQLRDPNRINLRYETPAESEYLIANLLAPVGAGTLSQSISQQEYSKLFERDRFGVVSSTEYLSRGAWVQNGAQFGTFGNSSYALEAFYRSDPGQRPNDDFEERDLRLKLKQQVTPQDLIFAQAIWYEAAGGDLIQYYDQANANPTLRTRENQDPIVSLGWHREWVPGVHTLLVGSRLNDRISVNNEAQVALLVGRVPEGLDFVSPFFIHQRYRSVLNIYTAELQQIWQQPGHDTIVGARFQTGDFDTSNVQFGPFGNGFEGFIAPDSESPVQQTNFVTGFERSSVYGYHHWQIAEPLLIIGGVSYDRITFPENFRAAPISDRQQTVERISPKAGLIWRPWKNMTVRGAYTRSLSGASIDQSSQLEPTQVAGFLQSFRSITPESIGGSEAGARFETYGVSLEQKFPTGTYLGLTAETLHSKVERTLGVFELDFSSAFARLGGTRDDLDYNERALLFTFNQLLSDEWSLAARYRLSDAVLRDRFVEVLDAALATEDPAALDGFRSHQRLEAMLHQLSLDARFHHRSGFFAQGQALWYLQSNRGYAIDRPGDEFWQFNLFAGYRFPRRKAEILIGLLNLTDQDYRLNPLTLYNELPRERTLMARFQVNF